MMSVWQQIPVGARAAKTIVVTPELTVAHFHPEMPEVYATPWMVYLMEDAAGAALAPYLPEGWVSVGTAVNVQHLAATPVGLTVTATAEVIEVGPKMVTLAVQASDGVDLIGTGTHSRAPVEMTRFRQGLARKVAQP